MQKKSLQKKYQCEKNYPPCNGQKLEKSGQNKASKLAHTTSA